jgi:hypothetical protein
MPDSHPLRQFLLLVFSLLLPCFALWYFTSDALVMSAIGLGNMILTAWLPDIVETLAPRGAEAILVTRFGELDGRHVTAQQTGEALAFVINTRILSYSIPFYTALHFALARDQIWSRYFSGFVVLYALLVAGLVSLALKDLMVTLGTTFTDHPASAIPHPNIIALLYQLSVLIIPPLAPVVIWVWQNREAPLFGSLSGLRSNRENSAAG